MSKWYIKDAGSTFLEPLSDLRASFECRNGGLTILERIVAERGTEPAGFVCADPLRGEMISARTGLLCVDNPEGEVIEHEQVTLWGVLDALPENLSRDLELADAYESREELTVVGEHRIDVHGSAIVFPNVVFDVTNGAIRVEENVTIKAGTVITGPCWIGRDSTLSEQSVIKANTVIGPVCKIGGEVGGTVFQGYANKVHDGHLGDSLIGEWVNLGAGTTNSNLLNTYGEIIVKDLNGKRYKTGRSYVGCFIGDHVKTAICTRIMTGTIIGTGAMIASSTPVPTPTARFAWITDGGTRPYNIEKFVTVAKTVMQRRNVVLHDSTESAIRQLASE
ncbi:MAG: hypothetical protein CMJ38_02025 [Phycisphaerae bacterium]|nr:hypothetical protein [Phycisphaerae bacterium]